MDKYRSRRSYFQRLNCSAASGSDALASVLLAIGARMRYLRPLGITGAELGGTRALRSAPGDDFPSQGEFLERQGACQHAVP